MYSFLISYVLPILCSRLPLIDEFNSDRDAADGGGGDSAEADDEDDIGDEDTIE